MLVVIQSVRHRGLRLLVEDDDSRLLERGLVDRIRNILTLLIVSETIGTFVADAPRGWRVHRLSGDRHLEWSVAVSGNWRITFQHMDRTIHRLNLEDYH